MAKPEIDLDKKEDNNADKLLDKVDLLEFVVIARDTMVSAETVEPGCLTYRPLLVLAMNAEENQGVISRP
jgi:hypothetical protein